MEVGNNGDHLMGDPVDRVKKGQARSASLPCRKQRYADQELLASLGYIERPCLKTDQFFFKSGKQTNKALWGGIRCLYSQHPGSKLCFLGSSSSDPGSSLLVIENARGGAKG